MAWRELRFPAWASAAHGLRLFSPAAGRQAGRRSRLPTWVQPRPAPEGSTLPLPPPSLGLARAKRGVGRRGRGLPRKGPAPSTARWGARKGGGGGAGFFSSSGCAQARRAAREGGGIAPLAEPAKDGGERRRLPRPFFLRRRAGKDAPLRETTQAEGRGEEEAAKFPSQPRSRRRPTAPHRAPHTDRLGSSPSSAPPHPPRRKSGSPARQAPPSPRRPLTHPLLLANPLVTHPATRRSDWPAASRSSAARRTLPNGSNRLPSRLIPELAQLCPSRARSPLLLPFLFRRESPSSVAIGSEICSSSSIGCGGRWSLIAPPTLRSLSWGENGTRGGWGRGRGRGKPALRFSSVV